MNPINTAIHANIGLIYMMDSTLPYVKQGDVIVIAPEYGFFYGKSAYGGEELLRTVLDTSPSDLWRLRRKQYVNIIEYLPKYVTSKMKLSEYFDIEDNQIYGVNSFNEYGDVYTHWDLASQKFSPYGRISGKFNYSVIDELVDFNKKCVEKGAVLFISFPGFQATSFERSRKEIMRVETELEKKGFNLLGRPERYKISNSLLYDTPYHLSKKGVDRRTGLLIEDIKRNGLHKKAQTPGRPQRLARK